MRRSARLAERHAKIENESQVEPKTKKMRSIDKITISARMDNGTMVEAFKYMNYCQLAKKSLVSTRFRDLIQRHRHSLPLLYAHQITMHSIPISPGAIKIFDQDLSPETYNEWVIRNHYTQQVPLGDQASMQSIKSITNGYRLHAQACNIEHNHCECDDVTSVFSADVELNHVNWPIFEHFVRLITDPFIYIDYMDLIYQNHVLNSLAGRINSDCDRLRCNQLNFDLNGNSQKFITWVKNHVRCNEIYIYGEADLNEMIENDEALLDFFVTGANCTSSINTIDYDLSNVIVDFVQKFLDLVSWDEYKGVHSIESSRPVKNQPIQVLKRDYAKFIIAEDRDDNDVNTSYVFEFINNAIGKKLELVALIFDNEDDYSHPDFPLLLMEIKNL